MRTRYADTFTTVRTEGALLPPDLLRRIVDLNHGLGGLTPEDYHLSGERLTEATNRAWNRLQGAWAAFQTARAALPETDLGTRSTRERWLQPLFRELGYGRLLASKAEEIDGRSYAVSHAWQHTPIHLVGFRVDLDKRVAGVAGAARTSPHGLVQELLNRADDRLWGFVSNGLKLRVLRDSRSLTRQAYLEFDLEVMMEEEIYADFVLLFLVCHQSRVEAERPEDCYLEKWSQAAQQQGTRALDQLRKGVEEAITALGQGFLAHPANAALRERLRSGELDAQDYYRQLLRLVYRLLFLFVAEDRELLFDPTSDDLVRRRYRDYFSTARLRALAEKRRGTRHADLYQALRLVIGRLGHDDGCPELGLPALGGFLFSSAAAPDLDTADLANSDLLAAVRPLAFTADGRTRRAVDYRNLGSEELGSVYEALLELHPHLNLDAATFELAGAAGNERKTTGSYYTPSSLIACLLDSALDPVVDEALKGPDPEQALLSLKICDPACGSGHFLIAAAHRLAKRLAALRTGDEEPSPQATRSALREVIGRCLYGVDVNPMAVELCKVSLWMEALDPGKPLSFLEHRILCGNSLLGTTPALLAGGIPDEAFKPIEGDDKTFTTELRRRNARERSGQLSFAFHASPLGDIATVADTAAELAAAPDDSMARRHQKEEWHRLLVDSDEYRHARLVADAWCAAFVWKKRPGAPPAVTQEVFLRLADNPAVDKRATDERAMDKRPTVDPATVAKVERLAEQYQFLHWHLAFPDVFRLPDDGADPENEQAGWNGGFDVVLGNPPWERIKLQEQEFFAGVRPDIADAPNKAARQKMITALKTEDPALYERFLEARRQAEGESHLVRSSGRFPLCGRGDVNTYSIFAETKRLLLSPTGRVGTIVPSGIATDDTTKFFFQDLVETRSLMSLYDFENREKLFPEVDSRMKFCLLTLTGAARPAKHGAEFAFFLLRTSDLRDVERRFTLSVEDLALLNPNTRTCPIFRTRRDAEITKAIYRRVPVLIKEGPPEENPWGIKFMAMFHMANDSHLFRTREQLETDGWELRGNVFERDGERWLPLYEAKMIHHFDHRWATYEGLNTRDVSMAEKADPGFCVLPRYWVAEGEVCERLCGKWDRQWLLGWRDIARNTDVRTVIAAVLPRVAIGNKVPLMLTGNGDAHLAACLVANLSSFAFDYASRQKIAGTTLNFFIYQQLPVLSPAAYSQPAPWAPSQTLSDWIVPRVVELAFTSSDLQLFARDCGYEGLPFSWDEGRRSQLRAELDAAFFHLYGISVDDVAYIMDSFHVVRRMEEATLGSYRAKEAVLQLFESMIGTK